jgi:hypothetical protein
MCSDSLGRRGSSVGSCCVPIGQFGGSVGGEVGQ